jgi:hypothetical protein
MALRPPSDEVIGGTTWSLKDGYGFIQSRKVPENLSFFTARMWSAATTPIY